MMNTEQINYHGWANSVRLSNPHIEMVITTDVGPRIIHFGFVGGENELKVFEGALGKTGGDAWHPYGGHRLWHAPEQNPRTYWPDNQPVRFEDHGDFVRTIQPIEATTGIEKEMDIYVAPDAPHARIVHRLRNRSVWPITLAVWAITVVAQRGVAIMPLPPRGSHAENLLPTGAVAIWPYTAMNDARWTWGYKCILLRQDPADPHLQKAGVATPEGWIAYARNNHLFAKLTGYQAGSIYPDMGCTIEAYTDENSLEIETLGPLTTVEPQQAIEHVEQWALFDGVPMPTNDDDIDTHIRPKIDALRSAYTP